MVTSDEPSARRSAMRRLINASTGPADLPTLARRRRIVHLISVALIIGLIVALSFSPQDDNQSNAATTFAGVAALLLIGAVVTGIQYSVRIRRLRRSAPAHLAVETREPAIPARSAAYQPIQQLRSAQQLLESALPDIEPVRKGIRATAERTRSSLEQIGRRVWLQEQVLATLEDSADPDESRIADMRQTLHTMTARLQSGVDRYLSLAQQASLTATSLADMDDGDNLQDATDELAGLDQGLHQVQQISSEHS